MLGPEFDGVLVRDGWAAYGQFNQAAPQTCLAHLIRHGAAIPRGRLMARRLDLLAAPGTVPDVTVSRRI